MKLIFELIKILTNIIIDIISTIFDCTFFKFYFIINITLNKITREVLEAAGKIIKPGITTDEIDRVVHEETIKRDAYPSPLNYMHYPKSVCTSVNEVICHGIPDNRKLEDGDIVNVDVSCYYKGFHGNYNQIFSLVC